MGPKNEAGIVIEPMVADVGVPAIRNDFGGSDLVVIEAWVRGLMVDIGSSNLAATKELVRAAVKRMP